MPRLVCPPLNFFSSRISTQKGKAVGKVSKPLQPSQDHKQSIHLVETQPSQSVRTIPTKTHGEEDIVIGTIEDKDEDMKQAIVCTSSEQIEQSQKKLQSLKSATYPQTEAEAEMDLVAIRDDRKHQKNVSQQFLDFVIGELSGSFMRVLQELLQNADDAIYQLPENESPTLNITYGRRTLRLDCNELGFSKENVKAICDLGRSSKLDVSLGYIGEKGIGFKSVFGIADEAWISSGFYSFKLVNDNSLGMITPISARFLADLAPGQTSIYLQLRQDCDIKDLLQTLRSLDPRVLMCLQQLKEINITVNGNKRSWKQRDPASDTWSVSLKKEVTIGRDGMPLVTLRRGEDWRSYVVFQRTCGRLPIVKQRATTSKLMLAFPTDQHSQEQVYAFLPIRNFGFKFIIQAPFILKASRTELASSLWNNALIEQIPLAVLDVIKILNSGDRRYSWLQYLPVAPHHGEPFQHVPNRTFQALKLEPILYTDEGVLKHPTDLIHVPQEFCDEFGKNLIPAQTSSRKQLSLEYGEEYHEALNKLGVHFYSEEIFLQDFHDFITNHKTEYRQMSNSWHSRVSKQLSMLCLKSDTHKANISSLEVIPLSNGQWVSSVGKVIITPLEKKDLVIPNGIQIFEIDYNASRDGNRMGLLLQLGAKSLNSSDICNLIIDTHASHRFDPPDLPSFDIVSHLVFLRESGWTRPRGSNLELWFVTRNGLCRRGSQIYIESDWPYSASKVFTGHESEFFLHEYHWSAFPPEDKEWQRWIIDNFNITPIPRLVSSNGSVGSFTLSNDFSFLIDNIPWLTVLSLLAEYWEEYSKWIVEDNSSDVEASKAQIRTTLGAIKVMCMNGSLAPLGQTLLPRKSVRLGISITSPNTSGSGQESLSSVVAPVPGTVGVEAKYSTELIKILTPSSQQLPIQLLEVVSTPVSEELAPSSFVQKMKKKIYESRSSQFPPLRRTKSTHCSTETTITYKPVPQTTSYKKPLYSSNINLSASVSDLFLDIPDPESTRWDFLEHFGVVVKYNINTFLKRLKQLRSLNPTTEYISSIYGEIEDCLMRSGQKQGDEITLIRESFNTNNLIFVPAGNSEESGKWINSSSCVWDGPISLRSVHRIQHLYPTHSYLFRSILGLTDADLKNLAYEAHNVNDDDNLEYIVQLLLDMQNILAQSTQIAIDDALSELYKVCMFPVHSCLSSTAFMLVTAELEREWFIVDNTHLGNCFEGIVDLLVMDFHTIHTIALLIQQLGLEGRLLSKAAEKIAIPDKTWKRNRKYTNSLRAKAQYIGQLIPSTMPERDNLVTQLRRIQVAEVESVTIKWRIKLQSDEYVESRPESVSRGRVATGIEGKILTVFMSPRDINMGCPPVELGHELSRLYGIVDRHQALLMYILAQNDLNQIEEGIREGLYEIMSISGIIENSASESDSEEENCARKQVEKPGNEGTNVAPPPYANPVSASQSKELVRNSPKVESVSLPKDTQLATITNFVDKHTLDLGSAHFIESIKEEAETHSAETNRHSGTSQPQFRVSSLFSKDEINTEVASDEVGRTSLSLSTHVGGPKEQNNTAGPNSERKETQELLPGSSASLAESAVSHLEMHAGTTARLANNSMESSKHSPLSNIASQHSQPHSRSPRPRVRSDDIGSGLLYLSPPMISFGSRGDEDIQFIGEFIVSGFLERLLGKAFSPEEHWTSQLRSRAGHQPFEKDQHNSSTFTFEDINGDLAKFVTGSGLLRLESLSKLCRFHMEAREFSITSSSSQKDIFILFRVYNIQNRAEIAAFVDPWRLHKNDSLLLQPYRNFRARFEKSAPVAFAQKSGEVAFDIPDENWLRYRNLDSHEAFRLLEIFPGEDNDPLEGKLHHVSTKNCPLFWAISYVWGAKLDPETAFRFKTPDGCLPITISLNLVLKQLRKNGISAWVWADAICINQGYAYEKQVQVRRMGSIYHLAKKVIAWVGTHESNSRHAMDLLTQVYDQTIGPSAASLFQTSSEPTLGWRKTLTEDDCKAIDELLHRDWFRRAWIVQEVIRASDIFIVCGDSMLQWDHFLRAIKTCQKMVNDGDIHTTKSTLVFRHASPAYFLGETREAYKCDNSKFTLLELLESFSYTRSGRKRDKMFALLGIASDVVDPEFDPDYTSPLNDIMLRYAQKFVSNSKAMDLLYRAGKAKSDHPCSWVPHFTASEFPKTISIWETQDGTFLATKSSLPRIKLPHERSCVLEVSGFLIDLVSDVSEFINDSRVEVSFGPAARKIRSAMEHVREYPTGENIDDLLWRIPIGNAKRPYLDTAKNNLRANRDFTPLKETSWPPNLGAEILSLKLNQHSSKFYEKPPAIQKMILEYWETASAFAKRIHRGKFCLTQNGYAGVVPGNADRNDKICLFHGSVVPFLLRKHDLGYELIGECYIHGMMFGETFPSDNSNEETFRIGPRS